MTQTMLSIIEISFPIVFVFLTARLFVNGETQGNSPLQIILPPEDTFPVKGNLVFSCKGTAFPEPNISWYDARTEKPLNESVSNIRMDKYVGRLTIANPEMKRTYSVYCNISNSAGWVASPVVYGGLAYLEHDFPKFPIDRSTEEGDLVLLECQPPAGNPQPTTEWLFNNAKLPSGWGLISPDGDLHIREVKPQHAGSYTCRAVNIAGERLSSHAVLQVKPRATRFLTKPKDTLTTLGSTVTFPCQVDGSTSVTWRKDNGKHSFDSSRVQFHPNALTIRNVQASDAGRYVCITADGSYSDARLTISGDSKYTLSSFPTDQNATEGETAVFHCRSANPRKFAIYWDLPNQATAFPNDRFDNIFVNELGDLHIGGVRLTDDGVYQCTVDSERGLVTKTVRLGVFPRPTMDTITLPPIINLPPASQTQTSGATVILDCEVGIPHPVETGFDLIGRTSHSRIFWVRDTRSTGGLQERIDFVHRDSDPRFSLLPGGGLQIDGVTVEDTGNYTCFMQSEQGPYMQSNWTASLVVLPSGGLMHLVTEQPMDPLSPPENLRVQNQTQNSVTLTWNPPNVRALNSVSYWIEMFHTAEPELGWQILQESWSSSAIRLEPLLPQSAYYFLIRLRWVGGRIGWASAPLGPIRMKSYNGRSYALVPNLIKLHDLKAQALSCTSARVAWSLVNSLKGAPGLTGFSVRYREVPLTRCISANVQDSAICSFLSGEQLSQQIHAYEKNFNTASLTDSQGVSLVPHEEPDMFADIPFDQSHEFPPQWSIILNHLKPFGCYLLLLQPNAVYPKTSESETALILLHEDAPSTPPQIVGVKKKSNHRVEISWTVPPTDSWNGLLTGFVVYVYNAAQNDKRELKFNYGDTNGILSGLKAGEIYHLQMTAVNCRGSSSKSIPINFSVSEGGIVSDTPPTGDMNGTFIQFHPWVIGVVICLLLIWLLAMFLAVIFCLRQRTQSKQRCPSSIRGDFTEDRIRKFSTALASKQTYNIVPPMKPQPIFWDASETEYPQVGDSSTQHNTATTMVTTNSPSSNYVQHPYEEGTPCQTPDFSSFPFLSHIPTQHIEYQYRPAEFSSNNVFATSAIENGPTTRLPLIAPVAQLAFPAIDNQSSCATPYATASLINAHIKQKTSAVSAGSQISSDMSSNAGGSHSGMAMLHNPPRHSMRPHQFISSSNSGATAAAEEDYLSQHNKLVHQQQIPSTFAEYELCIPHPSPLPIPQHQLSTKVTTNNSVRT